MPMRHFYQTCSRKVLGKSSLLRAPGIEKSALKVRTICGWHQALSEQHEWEAWFHGHLCRKNPTILEGDQIRIWGIKTLRIKVSVHQDWEQKGWLNIAHRCWGSHDESRLSPRVLTKHLSLTQEETQALVVFRAQCLSLTENASSCVFLCLPVNSSA